MKKVFVLISLIIFTVNEVSSNLTSWESISVSLFIYFLLEFIYDLGKRNIILDLPILLAILTWLIMPVIFYHEYTAQNSLAFLWKKFMPIPTDQYFSFAVPGTVTMILGLRVPLFKAILNKNPQQYMQNVQKNLVTKPRVGLILIGVGVFSSLLDFLSPTSLKQVFYLMDHLTYVGVFYTIYSPNKYKRIIVPCVLGLMVGQSIVTGMFGELIYLLALSVMLILLGKKIKFSFKLTMAVVGFFIVMVIQSIKIEYRKRSWLEGAGADPVYFAQLITERVTDPASMFDPFKVFFLAVRLNQGWLIAYTMNKVPTKYPFANGETIWQSVAASLVPRFLWPDKPEAGGKANLQRFWGLSFTTISMNLGPIGEAYANFDRVGGIIYMFFYGLFLNLVLSQILRLARKRPTLILWLPFLFLYVVVVEGDLLMAMNWLIKGAFFTLCCYWLFKKLFRIQL